MSGIGDFQNRVNDTLGPDFNFQIDRAHAGKSDHVDLSVTVPGGVDKVEVSHDGTVLGGCTQIGNARMNW